MICYCLAKAQSPQMNRVAVSWSGRMDCTKRDDEFSGILRVQRKFHKQEIRIRTVSTTGCLFCGHVLTFHMGSIHKWHFRLYSLRLLQPTLYHLRKLPPHSSAHTKLEKASLFFGPCLSDTMDLEGSGSCSPKNVTLLSCVMYRRFVSLYWKATLCS